MLDFERALAGKRVLVTGHTGFMGSWLSMWLSRIGAEVHGVSLASVTRPNLFEAAGVHRCVSSNILDIRDREQLADLVTSIDPVFVFHLAAQALVRRSYQAPIETFETNVLGTAYVLEACRLTKSTVAVVSVTTDKVYDNKQWIWAYRENDRLGGADPYSASKACVELIAECYRRAMNSRGNGVRLATVRGGNVIGGGDWSDDRLIPDFVRAAQGGGVLAIRNPTATRPWQHVLSLCHGCLLLASGLSSDDRFSGAWNFGPPPSECVPVKTLLDMLGNAWRSPQIKYQPDTELREEMFLAVDSTKARQELGWNPPWSLAEAVRATAEWYLSYYDAAERTEGMTAAQIDGFRQSIGASSPAGSVN